MRCFELIFFCLHIMYAKNTKKLHTNAKRSSYLQTYGFLRAVPKCLHNLSLLGKQGND
jgi:hypothetical protein